MAENKRFENKDWTKIIRTLVMVVIYFAMAFLVMYTNLFKDLFRGKESIQYGFALLFVIYGLWRAYRLWIEIRENE